MYSTAAKNDNIINESALPEEGSIVLIGVVDLKLNRDIFYKRNSFKSHSHTFDRYDNNSSQDAIEIPTHIRRWRYQVTKTCLNLIEGKKLLLKIY